jgi:hypothetical protein
MLPFRVYLDGKCETKFNVQLNPNMKTTDLAIISSAALVTATLTVGVFMPHSLDAGDNSAPEIITQPKLVSNGVEFTLTAVEHHVFQAGDEPAFVLKAVNTTGKDADGTVLVSMSSMGPSSPLSRMPAFPQMFWQKPCSLTLKPDETKIILLATATKLPAGRTITVKLQPDNPQAANANEKPAAPMLVRINDPSAIVAMSFSTLPPAQVATLTPIQP